MVLLLDDATDTADEADLEEQLDRTETHEPSATRTFSFCSESGLKRSGTRRRPDVEGFPPSVICARGLGRSPSISDSTCHSTKSQKRLAEGRIVRMRAPHLSVGGRPLPLLFFSCGALPLALHWEGDTFRQAEQDGLIANPLA